MRSVVKVECVVKVLEKWIIPPPSQQPTGNKRALRITMTQRADRYTLVGPAGSCGYTSAMYYYYYYYYTRNRHMGTTKNVPYVVRKRLINAGSPRRARSEVVGGGGSGHSTHSWFSAHKSGCTTSASATAARIPAATHVSCPTRYSLNVLAAVLDGRHSSRIVSYDEGWRIIIINNDAPGHSTVHVDPIDMVFVAKSFNPPWPVYILFTCTTPDVRRSNRP